MQHRPTRQAGAKMAHGSEVLMATINVGALVKGGDACAPHGVHAW